MVVYSVPNSKDHADCWPHFTCTFTFIEAMELQALGVNQSSSNAAQLQSHNGGFHLYVCQF